jgi:serine/threonine protein kinase
MPGAEHALAPGNDERPDTPDGSPGEPQTVAGYRLLRRVGEGGMSTVYLSYDVPTRRAVAVKLLADHLAGRHEFVNRFYREARLSRILHHPTLIQGYAAGYDPVANRHYLVLEFVDGPSAHTALTRTGRLPVGAAVRIGIDIARALAFLHARNFVHRDVKPDNVLLHPDGGAKLADLGLAKRLSDDSHLTSVNTGVGTSYYMPYEQALNAALVDGRSDIFALGATLYHLLTGQVPFPGATHEEIIRGKEHDRFVPVRKLNPDVPAGLADILANTLARDPRARFQDADHLADALAATRLATRIPVFVGGGAVDGPVPESPPALDAPTRADLPARGSGQEADPTEPADPLPPAPPPPGALTDDLFPPVKDRPSGASRAIPLVVGGVLVALGLLGLLSRCVPPPAGDPDAVVRRPATDIPGGLPWLVSQ